MMRCSVITSNYQQFAWLWAIYDIRVTKYRIVQLSNNIIFCGTTAQIGTRPL